jgi:hypothetical protein
VSHLYNCYWPTARSRRCQWNQVYSVFTLCCRHPLMPLLLLTKAELDAYELCCRRPKVTSIVLQAQLRMAMIQCTVGRYNRFTACALSAAAVSCSKAIRWPVNVRTSFWSLLLLNVYRDSRRIVFRYTFDRKSASVGLELDSLSIPRPHLFTPMQHCPLADCAYNRTYRL